MLREGGTCGRIDGWLRERVFCDHKRGEAGDGVSIDEAVIDLSEFLSSLVFDGLEMGNEPFEGVDVLSPVSELVEICSEVVVS
jgi:hypothetical protein